MPYRLKTDESVRAGLRRCSLEQVDKAILELTEGIADDAVEAIHAARKSLKKERSLLRLTRGAIDRDERRAMMGVLRDSAGKLSVARDADVMVAALDDLAERFSGTASHGGFVQARAAVVAHREEERVRRGETRAAAAAATNLRSARRGIDSLSLRRGGWQAIEDGLLRTYRRGRKAFTAARAEPTPENLHEWRKRVKDLWYHDRLLRSISKATMEGQADEAHRLSELLGDDHDLHVLRETLNGMAREIEADLGPLYALIDHRRSQLQTEAMLLGERVYAETPKAFRRRLHHYWRAWRAEAKGTRRRSEFVAATMP